MDGFTFFDIFQTKGVEYLIIIGFLILLIPFWVMINRRKEIAGAIRKTFGVLTANILRVPQGIYYSNNHTWTFMEKSGNAQVGVDDLLLHLTGKVKFEDLHEPGEVIRKGDLLAQIDHEGQALKLFSPISGMVVKTNSLPAENPDMISQDPYSKGWIYKIEPSNWAEETKTYLRGNDASAWTRRELERFKDFIAVSLSKHSPENQMVTLQDGGELRDNSLSGLPSGVWNDFQKEFLEVQ